MLNELFRPYKKIIVAVLLIGCAIVFWFFGCHRSKDSAGDLVRWEEEKFDSGGYGYHFETEDIQGEVVFGIKGYTVRNANIPVQLTILSSKKDFEGTIKITLPGTNSGGVAYQNTISCEKNQESQFHFSIPQLGNASYFCFEMLDAYGNTLLSKIEKPAYSEWVDESSESDGQICMGILSEEYSHFSFLSDLMLDSEEGKFALRPISLDETDFPETQDEIDMLSCVLIDNYEIANLSQKQRNLLLNWVKRGGKLIIATGEYAQKDVGPLSENLQIQIGQVENARIYFKSDTDFSGELGLYLDEIQFEEDAGWQRIDWSDPASYYERNYGNGSVEILRFSFNDEAILQWNHLSNMAGYVFQHLLEDVIVSDFEEENGLWSMEMALHDFNTSQMPNAFYYGIFFLVYLSCVVIFAYFMLNRLKKRELVWRVVPFLSLCFTLFIVLHSQGTSSETQSSLSAIRVIDDSAQKNSIFLLYQNEEGESLELNMNASIDRITPMDFDYVQENTEDTLLSSIQEEYTITDTESGYHIKFNEATPGTIRMLMMSENKTRNYGEKTDVFHVEVNGTYSSFYGKIRNDSKHDFSKVIAIRGNEYWIGGEMKAKESLTIDGEEVKTWSQSEDVAAMSSMEDNSVIADICDYLSYRYLNHNSDMNHLIVIGIAENERFSLLEDGSSLANQVSVYKNQAEIHFKENADCQVNLNLAYLKEESFTQLQEELLEGKVEDVIYQFPENEKVKYLVRNKDDFDGRIFAYNYWSGEKEEILKKPGDLMNAEDLDPYISEDQEMKLTYEASHKDEENVLPILSLWYQKTVY